MLKGNKGEWSEIYVLLKLLADGKLYSADSELNKIADVFKPVIKILREESQSSKIEYLINGNIKVVDSESKNILIELPIKTFINKAQELFEKIKKGDANSFSIPEFDDFLTTVSVTQLKAKSVDKADITIVVRDPATGHQPTVSFSVKSLIGKEPTLLNPGSNTNLIYQITHQKNKKLAFDEFNKDTYVKSKITKRLSSLDEKGFKLDFQKIESDNFMLNLQLLDGDLPKILSHLLILKYKFGKSKTSDLLKLIEKENPLNYNLSKGHPFYKYKLTSLLYDYALGMTPEIVWKGQYNANGGIIIVKDNSDVVCYHIYDKNLFQEYLINHTKFEQASTGEDEDNPGNKRTKKGTKKYYYGWVYEEQGKLFIKLNLQIRFI